MTAKSNVSYPNVLELGFTAADAKLVYGNSDPGLQYGLLWLPQNLAATDKAPLVILIHGGCWLNEFDIRHSFPLSAALAQAGYGVWSLEYRRSGDKGGGWPGSLEDIRRGIAFTSQLKDYPLDLDRVVIAGHSAGGHLALLAGTELPDINAIIGLAAITDIIEYSRGDSSCQRATSAFMDGKYADRPAAYHAANPADKSLHRHSILLHGDIDAIVPIEQAQLTTAIPVVVAGAGHFDWIHPGTKAYQRLISELEELFRQ
jgi:acetyl esterase/lipase